MASTQTSVRKSRHAICPYRYHSYLSFLIVQILTPDQAFSSLLPCHPPPLAATSPSFLSCLLTVSRFHVPLDFPVYSFDFWLVGLWGKGPDLFFPSFLRRGLSCYAAMDCLKLIIVEQTDLKLAAILLPHLPSTGTIVVPPNIVYQQLHCLSKVGVQ